jgi:rhomboid protease GluP
VTLDYDEYLERATAALASAGARPIRQLVSGEPRPMWTEDWDAILIVEEGALGSLYAFTSSPTQDVLQERLNRLASGLASLVGQAPRLDLVAVAVFPEGLPDSARRDLVGSTPSTYYQGLRPTTWVADLAAHRVYSPGMKRRPESDLLAQAMKPSQGKPVLSQTEAMRAGWEHSRRQQAFFSLMRGRKPIVTLTLIAINVAIFLWLQASGALNSDAQITDAGAFVAQLVEQGQWWRLFTAMFLHASITHIVFNMLSLFYLGILAERFYGNWKFLAIYIGSGLTGSLGSLVHAMLSGQTTVPSVGASGAIFGVAGALITIRFQSSDVIPQRIRHQVSTQIIPLVLLNLVFSALSPYIDNSAHIGGLIGGSLLSFLFPLSKEAPVEAG